MTDQNYMRAGLDFAVGKMVEECGELMAALGKTVRFGWKSSDPGLPMNERETNRDWVLREMNDTRDALDNLWRELRAANGDQAADQRPMEAKASNPVIDSYDRQLADVCAKNTRLEEDNRQLRNEKQLLEKNIHLIEDQLEELEELKERYRDLQNKCKAVIQTLNKVGIR